MNIICINITDCSNNPMTWYTDVGFISLIGARPCLICTKHLAPATLRFFREGNGSNKTISPGLRFETFNSMSTSEFAGIVVPM